MNHSVEVDDEHTGISLWRKYADIKKYVTNSITPFYFKCLWEGWSDTIGEIKGRDFVEDSGAFVQVRTGCCEKTVKESKRLCGERIFT